jgi:hypothetical protein
MSVVSFPLPDHSKGTAASIPDGPTADEGLRLIAAFLKIRDADMRKQLVRLAERFADQSP